MWSVCGRDSLNVHQISSFFLGVHSWDVFPVRWVLAAELRPNRWKLLCYFHPDPGASDPSLMPSLFPWLWARRSRAELQVLQDGGVTGGNKPRSLKYHMEQTTILVPHQPPDGGASQVYLHYVKPLRLRNAYYIRQFVSLTRIHRPF